jgi:heme o synthase
MIKKTASLYYRLTKPGIVYGNALVAVAGFLYASAGSVNWGLGISMLIGLSLIIMSACVLNNYFDRDIDGKMERTRTRALVAGDLLPKHALIFGVVLGLVGTAMLFFFTTVLALEVALVGWIVYVCMYTPLKRISPHALWVGAVAGATPPVVGYVAVTNTLDSTAWWLFLFLFIWQIPHFLAIATYRYEEYANAGVPLFIKKAPSGKAKRWGRIIFYASLVVLLAWCGALMLHR